MLTNIVFWCFNLFYYASAITRCGTNVEVIVIGAGGIGGLSAIEELQNNSINVTGLEASNRLGGRAYSELMGFGNIMCDMGASFLHMIDGENVLAERAGEAGIPLQPVEYKLVRAPAKLEQSSDIFYEGTRISLAEKNSILAWIEKFSKYKYDDQNKISFQEALDNFLLDNPTLTEREKSLIYLFVKDMVSFDNGEELRKIAWDPELISKAEGPADQIFYPGGYNSLVTELSKNIQPHTILFNQPVVSISHDNNCVTVKTETTSFTAPYAISFFPLAILQAGTVSFHPSLSRAKQDAINTMGVGHLNKACYLLKEPLGKKEAGERSEWQFVFKNNNNIGPQQTAAGRAADSDVWELMDYKNFGNYNLIVVFFQGDQARQFKDLAPEQIKDYHLGQLKELYPDDNIEILDYKISNWGSYPWSRGSYAYETPHGKDPAALSTSEGPIFFGGAHTTPGEAIGTTLSAYNSGKRTAREVCERKRAESKMQAASSQSSQKSATSILATWYGYIDSIVASVREFRLTDTLWGYGKRMGLFSSPVSNSTSTQARQQEHVEHAGPAP